MSANQIPNIVVAGQYIDVGDVASITITTTNAAGNAADPSALTVKVKAPGAAAVSYVYGTDAELTKSSTGVYVLAYPVTVGGTHHVRAITTGDAGAEPGQFNARFDNTV